MSVAGALHREQDICSLALHCHARGCCEVFSRLCLPYSCVWMNCNPFSPFSVFRSLSLPRNKGEREERGRERREERGREKEFSVSVVGAIIPTHGTVGLGDFGVM